MSSLSSSYRWRRRSQSFGSYGSCKEQTALEKECATVEKPQLIEGYAHICFNDEGSWLRGSLVTADGTAYNLAGHKVEKEVREEPDGRVEDKKSPDIVRDFPSPLRSQPGSGELSRTTSTTAVTAKDPRMIESAANCSSRQNSMDSNMERELQFILEEFPATTAAKNGESPIDPVTTSSPDSIASSRPGSPPTSQQILKALDNLLIREQSADCEVKNSNSHPSSPSTNNKVNNITSPFRSRSSSRSMADRPLVLSIFDITVSDLEEGTEHHIRRVIGRNGQSCTLRCRQLCFVTEKTFWGQRADLVIQKQLAAPELVGQGCHVFAGPMRFYFHQQVQPLSASFSNPRWCW